MIFYEVTVAYQRQTGEENPGNVKEVYLCEGLSPADVQARVLDEIKPMIFGDVEWPKISKKNLFDILTAEGENFYLGRVEMIAVDDNGAEKRKAVSILVQADDIQEAMSRLTDYLQSLDSEIVKVERSPILEVYRAVDSNADAE